MALSKNNNTLKLPIFLCVTGHFLLPRTTLLYNIQYTYYCQRYSEVSFSIPLAVTLHYMYAHTHSLYYRYLFLLSQLERTYFIYRDNLLSLNNLAYFMQYCKCYWCNGRLVRKKISPEL